MTPIKPMFFWVNNSRDKCTFCGDKDVPLLKSMATGKCLCKKCTEYLAEEIEDDEQKTTQ